MRPKSPLTIEKAHFPKSPISRARSSWQNFGEDRWNSRRSGISGSIMEDREFRKLLDMFPIVRSRDYCLNAESGGEKKEFSADHFWEKLKLAAEKKVGPEEADKFCKAFQKVYKKVSSDQNSEVIRKFLDAASR